MRPLLLILFLSPVAAAGDARAAKDPVPDCQCGAGCACDHCRCAGSKAAAAGAGAGKAKAIRWASDYAQAIKAATKAGRPVFVLITSPDTCPACRRFEAGALKDPAVLAELEAWECVKVDAAADPELAAAFAARVVPTVVIGTADTVIDRVEGDVTAAALLKKLKAGERTAAAK